jgi:hypothetical protein
VTVTRWTDPDTPQSFTHDSVLDRLDAFYSYLVKDRVVGQDVVATLLQLFRGVRGEVHNSRLDDGLSVYCFLDVLSRFLAEDYERTDIRPAKRDFMTVWAQDDGSIDVARLTTDAISRLETGFKQQVRSNFGFDFNASLAIRHAASAIFQEAHFTFEAASQSDLFAYQPERSSRPLARGIHHFTPSPLARTVIEQALASIPNVKERSALTVCDPACGSGSFLTETLRTLRRLQFKGRLTLIGRDISPTAIAMARFALAAAKYDWTPDGGLTVDISLGDALDEGGIPKADVIVMNPPFVAWPMMSHSLREKVRGVLGATAKHRPDISMAFVTRALERITTGGVVASLLPASILSLDSASEWRRDLLERARLTFLGSFGQYGLFVHALVQVAAVVFVLSAENAPGVALQSADESTATGEVFRALRKIHRPLLAGASGRGWHITELDQAKLSKQITWRVLPEKIERALLRLDERGVGRVTDFFDVKQGILTGLNELLILDKNQLSELPEIERTFFRPAVFRDAIVNAELTKKYFVFFPYSKDGIILKTEEQLETGVPNFSQMLRSNEARLKSRSGIDAEHPWWGLSRYYAWVHRSEPRILTKYFGGPGAFALDETAQFVPVQGYAWFALPTLISRIKLTGYDRIISNLKAYVTLLNSTTFERLLKVFSPHPVSGGQSNLSRRFIKRIPLPAIRTPGDDDLIRELVVLADDSNRLSPDWTRRVEELTPHVWGQEVVDALREMDDA